MASVDDCASAAGMASAVVSFRETELGLLVVSPPALRPSPSWRGPLPLRPPRPLRPPPSRPPSRDALLRTDNPASGSAATLHRHAGEKRTDEVRSRGAEARNSKHEIRNKRQTANRKRADANFAPGPFFCLSLSNLFRISCFVLRISFHLTSHIPMGGLWTTETVAPAPWVLWPIAMAASTVGAVFQPSRAAASGLCGLTEITWPTWVIPWQPQFHMLMA